jgi:F-type H+-transporting ATPase subunit delta
MAKKASARRYAQAIFEIALETKQPDKWLADLKRMAIAAGERGFLSVLENPKLKSEDRNRLLSGVLGGVSPLALNLLNVLITRASVRIISEIVVDYETLLNNYRGMETAEVTTAVPLDEQDITKLTERIGAIVGKKVVLKTAVDPSIIGGIVARVGGQLLDGSTRSQLEALRKTLVGAERKQ